MKWWDSVLKCSQWETSLENSVELCTMLIGYDDLLWEIKENEYF